MDGLWSAPPVPPSPSLGMIRTAHEERILPLVRALTGVETTGGVSGGEGYVTVHQGDPVVAVHTLPRTALTRVVLSRASSAREDRLDVASDGARLWVSLPSSARWTRLSLDPRRNVYVEDVASDTPSAFVRSVAGKMAVEAALDALSKSFVDRLSSLGLSPESLDVLSPARVMVSLDGTVRAFDPSQDEVRLPPHDEIVEIAAALRAGDIPFPTGSRGGYELDAPPGAPIRYSKDGDDVEGCCYLALNAALYGHEIVPLSHVWGRIKGDQQRSPVVRMFVDGKRVEDIKRPVPAPAPDPSAAQLQLAG